MTTPGQPLDLPADLWAIVYAASLSAEKAALRQVCSSARQGAFVACRHACGPTDTEMLPVMRRLPFLRSMSLRFHTRQACDGAIDALRAVAAERKQQPSGIGHVQDDDDGHWVYCQNLAELWFEVRIRDVRAVTAYFRLDQ